MKKLLALLRDRDVLAKIASLLLAVILWAFITSLKVEKQRYRLLIRVKNLPADLAVADMSSRYAAIELEGKRDEIGSVNIKGLKAVVDLEKAAAGERRAYEIQLEKQQFPEDIAATLVDKDVVVTVERKEGRWVRVVPVLSGSLPAGKVVIDRTVVPERVKIMGPRSIVNDIDSVETEELSLYNESGEVQRIVGLKKGMPREITVSEKIFMVKLTIVDRRDLVIVTAPVEVRNAPKEFEIQVNDREAEVYVRSRHNREVSPDDLEVFVDAGRLNIRKLFEAAETDVVQRELPVTAVGRNVATADIVSLMPKKTIVRITKR